MLPGVSGTLVSEYFLEEILPVLFAGRLGESTRAHGWRSLVRWQRDRGRLLGPVSSARVVFDTAAIPVAATLGFTAGPAAPIPRADLIVAPLLADDSIRLLLVTAAWSQDLEQIWRTSIRHGLAAGTRWCVCTNGRSLRLVDARATHARRFVQFDLDAAIDDERSMAALWALLGADTFLVQETGASDHRRIDEAESSGDISLIEQVVAASARHTVGVCRSLRRGVLEALGELLSDFAGCTRNPHTTPGPDLDAIHEQALTVVYRILFLLFAESRSLVPVWHPVYRDSYSLEAARTLAERPGPARGLWETLQAISRLAHNGCRAGDLRVTPFNGRLFAPASTPLGEHGRVSDESARRVVLALSTAPGRSGAARARIVYRDLGVEQLGAVYESVLDYRPRLEPDTAPAPARAPNRRLRGGVRVRLEPGGRTRKATGTFYTPRSITSHLVRQTLEPLVAHATTEDILRLRIVDPAMGSGAFLVAACRFLAAAYEAAVIEGGGCQPNDVSDEDRRGFRRLIVQRCVYGVDRNPVAVQLARLSLWLTTLAPDRPLTFLDHHLRVGDSLVGASLDDLRRCPPGCAGRAERSGDVGGRLPLFGDEPTGPDIRAVWPDRDRVAALPDDTLAIVREKERLLGAMAGEASPLARWRTLADLWCAFSFMDRRVTDGGRLFGALADQVLRGRPSLPLALSASRLDEAREAARQRRFFHWVLEFPEVFFSADGTPLARPGFDAVIGNPPWDMVRGDDRDAAARRGGKVESGRLLRFARDSGLYRAQGAGHANLYQLFVERAVRLARDAGRIGLVVPWGLAADSGCAPLRRLLLDRCRVDSLISFENANAIFPIHRSVRFLVFTASTGGRTDAIPCWLGQRDPAVLDAIGEGPSGSGPRWPFIVTRGLLQRVSADDLAIPDLRTRLDLEILERVAHAFPSLASRDGWGVEFGRELNASDDRPHFDSSPEGLPVLEGKHLQPFRVVVPADGARIAAAAAHRLLRQSPTFGRPRLAYRDVASATNRLTLIAAIVPGGCVTVHTLFCARTPLSDEDQQFLCGMFNSLMANYLVRQRVTTHVSAGIIARLPVPGPSVASPQRHRIASLAARLSTSREPETDAAYVQLQAEAAAVYRVTAAELEHILGTFPLIDAAIRRQVADAWADLR
ncbi:MAG TPA: N-6 DNA methylase [Vicinamibacterales bacterium]|jgi:hypothetical protein